MTFINLSRVRKLFGKCNVYNSEAPDVTTHLDRSMQFRRTLQTSETIQDNCFNDRCEELGWKLMESLAQDIT